MLNVFEKYLYGKKETLNWWELNQQVFSKNSTLDNKSKRISNICKKQFKIGGFLHDKQIKYEKKNYLTGLSWQNITAVCADKTIVCLLN